MPNAKRTCPVERIGFMSSRSSEVLTAASSAKAGLSAHQATSICCSSTIRMTLTASVAFDACDGVKPRYSSTACSMMRSPPPGTRSATQEASSSSSHLVSWRAMSAVLICGAQRASPLMSCSSDARYPSTATRGLTSAAARVTTPKIGRSVHRSMRNADEASASCVNSARENGPVARTGPLAVGATGVQTSRRRSRIAPTTSAATA